MIIEETEIRDVHGIEEKEKQRIIDFIQGAVYCWCKNRPNEWFAMRDLMGGENFEWKRTPLYCLYQKHINLGKESNIAVLDAGKDAGWLLKRVIADDKRVFNTEVIGLVRHYSWTGGENNE